MSDMPHSEAIFFKKKTIFAVCTVDSKSEYQDSFESYLFIYDIHLHYQIFLLFHLFDILLCIHLPLLTPLPLDLKFFPPPYIHFALARTLWFVGDHHLFWHADEFPSGHRQRWSRCFQWASPGSSEQDDVAVQQGEPILTQNLWRYGLCISKYNSEENKIDKHMCKCSPSNV